MSELLTYCEHGVLSDGECLRCELRAARAWGEESEARNRRLMLEISDLKDALLHWKEPERACALEKAVAKLLDMPSCCSTDAEILANNRVRAAARAVLLRGVSVERVENT